MGLISAKLEKRKFEVVPLATIARLIETTSENGQAKVPRPEKILSVSSDPSLAMTRALLLTGAGFQVSSARTVEKAIRLCEAEVFDLVVIGHSISARNKNLLLKGIRKLSMVPVLALYHHGEGRLEGADYVLDSNEGPTVLLETVNRIVRGELTCH